MARAKISVWIHSPNFCCCCCLTMFFAFSVSPLGSLIPGRNLPWITRLIPRHKSRSYVGRMFWKLALSCALIFVQKTFPLVTSIQRCFLGISNCKQCFCGWRCWFSLLSGNDGYARRVQVRPFYSENANVSFFSCVYARRGNVVPGVPCGDRGNWIGIRIATCHLLSQRHTLFCEVRLGKIDAKDVELFRKGSVHEFYRLKALNALEQVNTSVKVSMVRL